MWFWSFGNELLVPEMIKISNSSTELCGQHDWLVAMSNWVVITNSSFQNCVIVSQNLQDFQAGTQIAIQLILANIR